MAVDAEPSERSPRTRPSDARATWTGRLAAFAAPLARLPTAWRRAVIAILALRAVLALFGFAFGGLLEGNDAVDVEPMYGTGFRGWAGASAEEQGTGLLGASLERFDALWYLAIARDGYPLPLRVDQAPSAAAFFPGFPMVVAVLGRLLASRFYLAGSLAAVAFAVAALAGVHRLIEEETGDERLAGRSLVALAVFPAAFFLVAPFSEAMFLAASAWALVWSRRGRWGWAAALATTASITRNVGVLLILPMVLEAWRQHRAGRRLGIRAWAAAVAGAPAGLAAVAAFALIRYGTPFAPVQAQVGWERQWTLPTVSLADSWRFGTQFAGQYPAGYHSVDLIVFIAVALAVVWLLVRTPLPYGVYAAAHVLVWLTYPFPGRPLMSAYRFALAIAPLPWAFGAWTRSSWVGVVWRASSSALLGVMFLLFIHWYFVF
ncbi:MAG: hypothetical protein M3N57_03680 [Actinomycetota bacterium]|nr:hypothetical protein [Actinomycetota bacterium]